MHYGKDYMHEESAPMNNSGNYEGGIIVRGIGFSKQTPGFPDLQNEGGGGS